MLAVRTERVQDKNVANSSGVYGLLLALTLTGLLLVVPSRFSPAIKAFSPLTPFYHAISNHAPGVVPVSADAAANIALGHLPGASIRWIETPSSERAVWRIQLRQEGEPNRRFPRTNVWIDASSSQILGIRDPRKNSAGDTLIDWLHPLHNGEAFGLAGRIIVLVCGFLPLLVLVTGIVRWRHKTSQRLKKAPVLV
jgi:uncharacterized iron-regulated membrane protein